MVGVDERLRYVWKQESIAQFQCGLALDFVNNDDYRLVTFNRSITFYWSG